MFYKCLLYTNNWLNGCVSIERVITIYKGVNFDKIKSKQLAKRIIFISSIVIMITLLHEPMNRYLFDDIEEQRIWCVFHHSELLKNYNSIITIFHFITPFMINLFSAIFIIISVARQRTLARNEKNYKQQLQQQFYEHGHILISIIVLFILSLPRLIISFISDCVRSSRNPWFFLAGYFISFIPSALMFVVFVLPSPLFKKEFKKAIMCY